jgi:hypothetical protein
MGRARQPGRGPRAMDAYGPRYDLFVKRMWGRPPPEGVRGLPCAFCGEPITPGRGEIDHRIPPSVRPDLAQSRRNVRPVHGSCWKCPGGGVHSARCRRSPSGLACNAVAAGNLAPKDSEGWPVAPWPPEFKRAAIERAQARDRAGAGSVTRRKPRNPARKRPEAAETAPEPRQRVFPEAGRAWLRWTGLDRRPPVVNWPGTRQWVRTLDGAPSSPAVGGASACRERAENHAGLS